MFRDLQAPHSKLSATALVIVLSLSTRVSAVSEAFCYDSAWDWAYNSKNQSPCDVAQALGNVCRPAGDFTIQAIPEPGYYYSGFDSDPEYATQCVCNTVYYSLLSACGQCQDGYAAPWDLWKENCTTVFVQQFPKTLPIGFSVPDWAYEPLLTNNTVNFAAAKTDQNAESSAPSSPPYNTQSSTSGGGKKKLNIAAIAGGAAGGVVALILIGVAVFFILRRKNKNKKSRAPSALYNSAPPYTNSLIGGGVAPMNLSEKPYDPNDPSTFPTMLHPPSSPLTPPLSPPVSTGPTSFISTPFVPPSEGRGGATGLGYNAPPGVPVPDPRMSQYGQYPAEYNNNAQYAQYPGYTGSSPPPQFSPNPNPNQNQMGPPQYPSQYGAPLPQV